MKKLFIAVCIAFLAFGYATQVKAAQKAECKNMHSHQARYDFTEYDYNRYGKKIISKNFLELNKNKIAKIYDNVFSVQKMKKNYRDTTKEIL